MTADPSLIPPRECEYTLRRAGQDIQKKPLPHVESLEKKGLEGEIFASAILRRLGHPVQRTDGFIKFNGDIYAVEIKNKEPFESPPFDGQGINLRQYQFYELLLHEKQIRCLFITVDKSGNFVAQYLDRLGKTRKHLTKNNIVIFPLDRFEPLEKFGLKKLSLADFL